MKNKILIVGAGFAGAVHARELAEANYKVTIIDKRNHIAGNCYDYIDQSGIRIHQYGPHLFHTSNKNVFDYLSKFTDWVNYEHKVVVRLPDQSFVPLPINIETINKVFDQSLINEDDVKKFLDKKSIKNMNIVNAEDWLYSKLGEQLTNLFYRPYTKKMWGLDLKEISHSIVKRIKFSFSKEKRYFPNDTIQCLPDKGYTSLFENIYDHENIKLNLSTSFDSTMLKDFDFCFNSMPIDEFYDYCFGHLPYRSVKFTHDILNTDLSSGHVTINYSDSSIYTRETWWHNIANHHIKKKNLFIRTKEEPCGYEDNNYERYYPVKTHDDKYGKTYKRYKKLSENKIDFIGRCGTYQYLDMHQVINQSIINVSNWINTHE